MTSIEAGDMESLRLESYLDLLPLSAMILTLEGETVTPDTLKVSYVNKVFLEIVEDSHWTEEERFNSVPPDPITGIGGNFVLLLQEQFVTPSSTRFLEWIEKVMNAPNSIHYLKTRVQGFTPTKIDATDRSPHFVDIEWNAVIMQKKFIVLTGRTTGTVQFSTTPTTKESEHLGYGIMSPPIEEEELEGPILSSANAPATASSTSSSDSIKSRRKPNRAVSSTTQSTSERTRRSSFADDTVVPTASSGDTWRNNEKFVKTMAGGGLTGTLFREKDWSKSPLGPVESWPQSLLTMVSLMMDSSFPMSLWWGPELYMLYNDGYAPIAGDRHPHLFGNRAKDHWYELLPVLEPLIADVYKGQSVYNEDQMLVMHRHGYVEETYFTWSYIPVREESGKIAGILNRTALVYNLTLACFESTDRILAERRLKTLRELDSQTSFARTMEELGKSIGKAFTFNPYDIPYALIYLCSTEYGTHALNSTSFASSTEYGRRNYLGNHSSHATDKSDPTVWIYQLQDTVGVPEGHILAPQSVEIHLQTHGIATSDVKEDEVHLWPFRRIAEQQVPIQVRDISSEILEGIDYQGWPEIPKDAISVPILGARDSTGKDALLGMLVLGINPRREFDDTYQTFAKMCARQVAAAVTMVKSIQEEAARAEELAALNRDRTSFFNSVSHELRTPLTLIMGPLDECLEDPSLSQQHKGRLDMVGRNARRLLRLVNSLLDFSRVEAGKMSATFRETNVQKYTADLASLFRSAIEKGGVKYIVDTKGKERSVWVDRDMWEVYPSTLLTQKIVFNLIGNAFKFTLSGHITVTCRLSEDGHHMVFSVQDTGTGIPSHEINRIFEKFHRVHDQKGRSYEGTGIGLALTQELVKLHGGKIEVESIYGHGTTFTIQIPVGNSHLPEQQLVCGPDHPDLESGNFTSRAYGQSVVEEAGRWAINNEPQSDIIPDRAMSSTSSDTHSTLALQTAQWVPISSRGCRILVADDNEDMRRYVKGVLLQFYDVIDAANGQDALAIAMEERPDMILSDIMMSGLDGFGLLKVIRSSPETRSIPFILLSAKAGDEARVEGLLAGADDYLAKPFNARELIARVHTHLDIARMMTELEKRVKERTKDLMESEARYRILSAISPAGIFRVDTSGTITYGNQKWREITGNKETLDDSIGEKLLAAVHPDDREWIKEHWNTGLANVERFSFEVRWGSRDSFRWAMGELVPEIIGDELSGFIGVLTDVTERRQSEADKLDAAEEVRAQQELAIDVICHELRNPLNGIYHNADIVSESVAHIREQALIFRDEILRAHGTNDLASVQYRPEDSHTIAYLVDYVEGELDRDLESLEALTLCAKHQKRICDDVIYMSKLSMNLVSLTEIPFDPLVETSNVLQMFEREAFVKDIAFKFTLGQGYRDLNIEWLYADPIRFAQVLLNFLSNAVRFTEKRTTRIIDVTLDASIEEPNLSQPLIGTNEVTQRAERTLTEKGPPVFLIASVADSGVGLTEEEQRNLFQKFSQASPRTHIEYGGSGLGLFISRALVEVQGGRISLESEKDKGTTLTFYIAAQKVAAPPKKFDVPAASTPSISLGPGIGVPNIKRNVSSTSMMIRARSTNVLVVEDNLVFHLEISLTKINQKLLIRQLQLAGFRTAVANHGVECLDMLASGEKFDIVLMDLEMPVLDGFSAASEIRRRESAGELDGRIPIIAVTGNARREYIDKATSIGIDSFIVKPYEKQDLLDKVRALTEV